MRCEATRHAIPFLFRTTDAKVLLPGGGEGGRRPEEGGRSGSESTWKSNNRMRRIAELLRVESKVSAFALSWWILSQVNPGDPSAAEELLLLVRSRADLLRTWRKRHGEGTWNSLLISKS